MLKIQQDYNSGNVAKYNGSSEKKIDGLLAEKDMVIMAIDGKCNSGKTTLASKLAEIYDCNVFHMDDFFLRPEQRTPERFAEVGGNVDYERFWEEVLLPLKSRKAFFTDLLIAALLHLLHLCLLLPKSCKKSAPQRPGITARWSAATETTKSDSITI